MLNVLSKLSISIMALTLAFTTPTRYKVVEAAGGTEYISEVKVGMDKTEAGAVSGLLAEGYTILSENGKYADLNEDAGSDAAMARGQKKVYLGYKTTTDPKKAITDLAVMNMRGGYNIRDYEVLMANQLKTQILPFVERFIATLQEYRENLNSPYAANKARAEYMKAMLNKLQDDDTGGLLGDLLVNETKFEMGDEAYNALSDEEKKQHADIVTIVMQANGKSTLSMETLLTKASDSAETSWIKRLPDNSLEELRQDLIDEGTDPTEVDATLDRKYGDAAAKILEKWDTFSQALYEYDDVKNDLLNEDASEFEADHNLIKSVTEGGEGTELNEEVIEAFSRFNDNIAGEVLDLELVAAKERLDDVPYDFGEGTTLSEFFALDSSTFNREGIRNLYPIVASLSAGQIAGLDFLSLQDLVTIATADATSYDTEALGDMTPVSIYEGVNREIFQKGKVALTNKALRAEAMKNDGVVNNPVGGTTVMLYLCTFIATLGMAACWSQYVQYSKQLYSIQNTHEIIVDNDEIMEIGFEPERTGPTESEIFGQEKGRLISDLAHKSKVAAILGAAVTVAMAALAAYTIYTTIKELLDYYQVDYSPIPKYIVEETDITEEVNGVKTVVRNDSAYYQVAECNRPANDEFYGVLQNYADLNGDVGKEWLALYYVRQDGHAPIKADSFKVVKGTSSIPSGYTELGIHNFETKAAFNLTSKYYCYNDATNGTYVYYQVDESVLANASAAGSNFSTGSAVLFSGIGAVVGAGIGIAIMLFLAKKKETRVNE